MKHQKKPDRKNLKSRLAKPRRARGHCLEAKKEAIRKLLEHSDDLEAKLSPEAKALLNEIRTLREKIGPVPFKVNDLIREIREH